MASSAVMLRAGIADVGCTMLLVYMAYIGDVVLRPIVLWSYSIRYPAAPPLDNGVISGYLPIFYAMMLLMFVALQIALYLTVISTEVNSYGN